MRWAVVRRRTARAVAAAALALAATAAAAQPVRVRVVGYLSSVEPAARREPCLASLAEELARLGWREGVNLRFVIAHAERDEGKLPGSAAMLAARRPDVLVAAGLQPVLALHAATRRLPIVALGTGFLRGAGLIDNLRRPGGNVTGIALAPGQGAKMLEVLQSSLPGLRRIGWLRNARNPGHSAAAPEMRAAAAQLGIELAPAEFDGADGIAAAWQRLAALRVQAVVVQPDLGIYAESHARTARQLGLPAISHHHRFARLGGAFAYGPTADFCARGAAWVDRLLRGADAATLPLDESWDFSLVVNAATLREMGLTPSAAARARAAEVID